MELRRDQRGRFGANPSEQLLRHGFACVGTSLRVCLGPCMFLGVGANNLGAFCAFDVLGFGVIGFDVLGFCAFDVLGFDVLGFDVISFGAIGFGAIGFGAVGFGVLGFGAEAKCVS